MAITTTLSTLRIQAARDLNLQVRDGSPQALFSLDPADVNRVINRMASRVLEDPQAYSEEIRAWAVDRTGSNSFQNPNIKLTLQDQVRNFMDGLAVGAQRTAIQVTAIVALGLVGFALFKGLGEGLANELKGFK